MKTDKLLHLVQQKRAFRSGGALPLPKAQGGRRIVSANPEPTLEEQINQSLDYPMRKAAEAADTGEKWFNPKTKKWEKEDTVDNLRHAMAGRYAAEAIANKFPALMQYTPIPKTAGFLGANILGAGHELTAINDDPSYSWWDKAREAGEDIFNNIVGSAVGSVPLSDKQKTDILFELSRKNLLPDGYGKGDMYFKEEGGLAKAQLGPTVNTAKQQGNNSQVGETLPVDPFTGLPIKTLRSVTVEGERPDTYTNYMANKYKDASLLGAMVGMPLDAILGFPQAALTKAFTGKYQLPSEAMGIENPIGAVATDVLLDPTNLVGLGALTKEQALSRLAAGKKLYNTIATGESILPVAWKSPAVGLSEKASENMFKNITNSANLTDAERAIVADYQYSSRPYTGRNGNVDPIKKQAITDIVKKYAINVGDDAIATRMFNPENNSLGATLENSRLNFGDRPTSFTVGAKGRYGSGATDRLVIPNRYLKKMGNNFVKNTYEPLSEDALKLVGNIRDWAAEIGVDPAMLGKEKEIIGSGLDFKRIGKVKNDVGGYDWIVKPYSSKKNGGLAKAQAGLGLNPPIYVSDRNDPRLRSYNDSLDIYNANQQFLRNLGRVVSRQPSSLENRRETVEDLQRSFDQFRREGRASRHGFLFDPIYGDRIVGNNLYDYRGNLVYNQNVAPIEWREYEGHADLAPVYKRPVQPVIYEDSIKKMPMRGVSLNTEDIQPQYVNVPALPKVPIERGFMDWRGEISDMPPSPDMKSTMSDAELERRGFRISKPKSKQQSGGLTKAQNGKVKSFATSDLAEYARSQQAYADSLNLHNEALEELRVHAPNEIGNFIPYLNTADVSSNGIFQDRYVNVYPEHNKSKIFGDSKIKPIGFVPVTHRSGDDVIYHAAYKKPVRPVKLITDLMMPDGNRIKKDDFIKLYGENAWLKATNQKKTGGLLKAQTGIANSSVDLKEVTIEGGAPSNIEGQNTIVQRTNPNKNYAIVDKVRNKIYYYSPAGELIKSEPIITGKSNNDIDRGPSMKDWFEETGSESHDDYFKYLEKNKYQTTPSGVYKISGYRTNTAKDPSLLGRVINTFRPERAAQIRESRLRDYGLQEKMFTLVDENNKGSSKAIHGTNNPIRVDALRKMYSDRNLSNGCVNVNGETICFDTLGVGSNVYIMPEEQLGYLYPKQLKANLAELKTKKKGGQTYKVKINKSV